MVEKITKNGTFFQILPWLLHPGLSTFTPTLSLISPHWGTHSDVYREAVLHVLQKCYWSDREIIAETQLFVLDDVLAVVVQVNSTIMNSNKFTNRSYPFWKNVQWSQSSLQSEHRKWFIRDVIMPLAYQTNRATRAARTLTCISRRTSHSKYLFFSFSFLNKVSTIQIMGQNNSEVTKNA